MSREPWQAPRIAYLLTAAVAEADAAAGHALWAALDERGQAGVLTALGAQLRVALRHTRPGEGGGFDISVMAAEACALVPEAIAAVMADEPWEPHPCPHCREFMAAAMAAMIVGFSRAGLGIPAEVIARNCRRVAEKVTAL